MTQDVIVKFEANSDERYGCRPEERKVKDMIDYGIVVINKPAGPTSHQVSDYVKKTLGISRCGHGGTLDPKVNGVLPIALGRATRIVETLLKSGKEYVALMHLHKEVDRESVESVFNEFTGKIKQMPPVKSAVRRQLREREIYYLKLLEMDGKNVLFKVGCQAGTYIRKLCLHPKVDILSSNGFINAESFYSNISNVYSLNKKNRIIKKMPSAVQMIKSPKRMIRLTMSSGVDMIVTPDHELLKSTTEGYKMVEAQNLNKEDYLAKSLFLPSDSKDYIISDLLDDGFLVAQPEIKQMCKEAFISKYGSIRGMYRKLKLDRKAFLSKSNVAISIKHLKLAGIYDIIKYNINTFKTEKGNIIKIKRLNPDIFYLLGLVASDGNNTREKRTKRFTRIKFHNTNEELINIFFDIYRKIFPTVPISKKGIKNGKFHIFQLDTSNSLLATIAASLGIKSPQKYSDILPILNVKPDLIKAFIRGYFDGDGTAYYKKKKNIKGHYTDIRFFSVSYTNAKRLHQMLLKLNISNRIFKRRMKRLNRWYYMYIVSLDSLASKHRFIKEIGTNHSKKKAYFERIIKLNSNELNDNYYIGLHYKEFVRKNKSKLHNMGGNLNRVLANSSPITRYFYRKASKLNKLPSLDNMIIEKIDKIDFIDHNGYVYDMTVPKSHNFLIETGFVSSNCHDMGQKLGTGAHMQQLIRTKAGPFTDDEWHSLHDLKDAYEFYLQGDDSWLRKIILPIESAVVNMKKVWMLDNAVDAICHGANVYAAGIAKLDAGIMRGNDIAIMTLKDELIGIGKAIYDSNGMKKHDKGIAVKLHKVFMARGTYPKAKKETS